MVFIKNRLGILLLVVVTLCSGFIFANVQAASTLADRYTETIPKEDDVNLTLEIGIWTSFKELGEFIVEAKQYATSLIDQTRNTQVDESKANLDTVVTRMKEDVDQTVADLENENFDAYVTSRNIEEEIEQEVITILEEILGE